MVEVIGVLLAIILLTIVINGVEDYCKQKKRIEMDFSVAMELAELPVVTFYNSGKKVNLLLDTGSNNSIINKSALEGLDYEENNSTINTFGMEGKPVESSICKIKFYYKNKTYENEFSIIDMDEPFNQVKKETGVTINGILGSKFFEKYKYVLDFAELVAYPKK